MKRIDTQHAAFNKFGAGKTGFQNGRSEIDQPATRLDATWFDHVQEEIANVIEGAGIALDPARYDQLRLAIQAMIAGAVPTMRDEMMVLDGQSFAPDVQIGEVVAWDQANNRWARASGPSTTAAGVRTAAGTILFAGRTPAIYSGLTPGATYWLSASSPGAIVTTRPAGDATRAGVAISATRLILDIDLIPAAPMIDASRLVPAGMVAFFPGSVIPVGWLECNGALLSRAAYPDLFAFANMAGRMTNEAGWYAGTTAAFSSGDAATNFRIPDLRGEFLRGLDNGRGLDPGRGIGTAQKGSAVAFDTANDALQVISTSALGAASLASLGFDPMNLIEYGGVNIQAGNSVGVTPLPGTAGAGAYSGIVRPRNAALVACIKF